MMTFFNTLFQKIPSLNFRFFIQYRYKFSFLCASLIFLFVLKSYNDIQPVVQQFKEVSTPLQTTLITDRYGEPIYSTYQTRWNHQDLRKLHYFPEFLIRSLIYSEDQSFFQHCGVDWKAKLSAVYQNIRARRIVRGASTITEQVIHMLNPRPRTFWTKWIELIESIILERSYTKSDILEFYLNQVPFASNRNGMLQAAKCYFNRDLDTLNEKEILALVILLKAPTSYDLKRSKKQVERRLIPLEKGLKEQGILKRDLFDIPLLLSHKNSRVNADHFLNYVKDQGLFQEKTTLDGHLQNYCSQLLTHRLKNLLQSGVQHGAILVADHQTGEILAWVVGSGTAVPTSINAVLVRRQPGSTLKPFVYAQAFDKGWRGTTLIEDAPLVGAVGTGFHKFRNYSNTYYGFVTVREALANSLNIPAVKALQFVGVNTCLETFHQLGMLSLTRGSEIYNEGLVLGNGEISLFELVQAYTVFPNGGKIRPLIYTQKKKGNFLPIIFSPFATSLIGDILSDPQARRFEFGSSGIMNFPVQTAIKTGTSNDYRDSLAVGYNHRYVVGIWLGNLENKATKGVTGSLGAVILLRGIFSYLNKGDYPQNLPVDQNLIRRKICLKRSGDTQCTWQSELVLPDDAIPDEIPIVEMCRVLKPTPNLKMAIDLRIPLNQQKFEFQLSSLKTPEGVGDQAEWIVDGQTFAKTKGPRCLWSLERGNHTLKVIVSKVHDGEMSLYISPEISFTVK